MKNAQLENMSVEICLTTYNGESYVETQIHSILSLEENTFKILAHDDGSHDFTPSILERIAQYDDRLQVIQAPPTGGASNNFSMLLGKSEAQYVLCSDQDDVWLPDKLTRLIQMMRFYESVYGEDVPLLVHSDLRLISDKGYDIAKSFWSYQRLDPRWGDSFNLILTQNVVTGCAMMVNRALLNKALPMPKEVVMHDWWLALVACAFGKIAWLEEPTVLYRQHGGNEVGAKKFDYKYLFMKAKNFEARENIRKSLQNTSLQAAAFAERFPESPQAAQARLFAQLPQMTPWQRRRTILQEQFFKIGLVRNLAWLGLT